MVLGRAGKSTRKHKDWYNIQKRDDGQSKSIKDVRGWQFLTMKAAETLCIVCLPPEEHIS